MAISIVDHGTGNRVEIPPSVLSEQTGSIVFDGHDNTVVIGEGATLQGGRIHFGSNCSFECGRDCRLASIEVYAVRGGHVRIGDGTGFTWHARVYLHESGEIVFGAGCLIAGGTSLSVSDMHSIVDVETGRRLNPPRDVRLGDRVWIGENARILKGVTVGEGSVVGAEAVVTKDVPANCVAAGNPAKVVRMGVTWRPDLVPVAAAEAAAGARGPGSVEFAVRRLARSPREFVTEIDPADDVFRYGRSHFHDDELSVLAYLRYGAWITGDFRQIADWRFGGLDRVPRVLEFACGFGRQTRYLVQELPKERIWCSDVDARAVEFVRTKFGVNTFLSSRFPGEIKSDEKFELITVVSLFSHLPRHTFAAMLERLLSMLAPGGVLAFSVHDELWHPGPEMPEDGFAFIPHSESRYLSGQDYGTTFVTEAFVRRCIEGIKGTGWPCLRLPRGLCSHQDLYLVGNDATVGFGGLRFRLGPEGCLENCRRTDSGGAELTGWVGDPDEPDGAAAVHVSIDGELVERCRPDGARPDVASVLRQPKYATTGWRCLLGAGGRGHPGPDAMVEVVAVSRDGRSRLLHAGRLANIIGRKLC